MTPKQMTYFLSRVCSSGVDVRGKRFIDTSERIANMVGRSMSDSEKELVIHEAGDALFCSIEWRKA